MMVMVAPLADAVSTNVEHDDLNKAVIIGGAVRDYIDCMSLYRGFFFGYRADINIYIPFKLTNTDRCFSTTWEPQFEHNETKTKIFYLFKHEP